MKNKITLLTILIAITGFKVYSQSILNTSWKVNNTSNMLFSYFRFGTDTLYISFDKLVYTSLCTFQVSGNTINITDLPSGGCPATNIGKYTFLIKNDTLKFTLISDLCTSRQDVISTYHWINLFAGIQSTDLLSAIKLYPNPASDEIFIKANSDAEGATYFICDQLGRQVLNGKLTGKITPVDIKQLSIGLYFLQIEGKGKQTIKLIKN